MKRGLGRGGLKPIHYRSEGRLHARNGLCHSCTCGRVGGVGRLLAAVRCLGFVVLSSCRLVAGLLVVLWVRRGMGHTDRYFEIGRAVARERV